MQPTEGSHLILPRQTSVSNVANATQSSPPAASTSYLPLTTIFPVPTSCWDRLYTALAAPFAQTAFRDFHAVFSECYPESYAAFEGSETYANGQPAPTWYSPGVCPSGYHIASSTLGTSLDATSAWCCPSGESLGGTWGSGRLVCTRTVLSATSLLLNGGGSTSTNVFWAYDWPVSVMWASSDLSKFTPSGAPLLANAAAPTGDATNPPNGATTYATSLSTDNTVTAQTGPSQSSLMPSTVTTKHSGGLSSGAYAGIGVGVALVGLGLLAIAGFMFYRQRQRSGRVRESNDVAQSPIFPSQSPYYKENDTPLAEMHSKDPRTRFGELPGNSYQAELEGNRPQAFAPYRDQA